MKTAKLFMTGGSQAVRLPKEFRFQANEVLISRQGNAILLEPKARGWPKGFFQRIRITDPKFKRPAQGALPPLRKLP